MTGLSIFEGADSERLPFLILLLGLALAFEFVNGFHDTANAVATVIYTNSLRPRTAVALSGLCNFLGVHLGGTAVAFSIVYLLPVELLVSIGSGAGMAMVLALLTAAIVWNLGTWLLGLPASSSHTLIGAILGIGLANALLQGRSAASGVNWAKALEVLASLLISPGIGLVMAALLYAVLSRLARDPRLEQPPEGDNPPPRWIRAVLIGTCSAVSLAHGSNDGQKGVGLIMLILIGLLPARYALDPQYGQRDLERAVQAAGRVEQMLTARKGPALDHEIDAHLRQLLDEARHTLARVPHSGAIDRAERLVIRGELLRIERALSDLTSRLSSEGLSREDERLIVACRAELRKATDFAPTWVTFAVACALGCGTMIGWKRIVVTIGEKIGKRHMTPLQGAAAEVVAAVTIAAADLGGMPVSTTHVLSSGVAGTMVVARAGLQYQTLYRIAIAWVLTMPASMCLSGSFFAVFMRWVV